MDANLDLSKITIFQWMVISIGVITCIYFLIRAIREFEKSSDPSYKRKPGELLPSIIVGLYSGGIGLSFSLIISIIISEGKLGATIILFFLFSLLIAPPMFVIVAIGYYFQVFWKRRLGDFNNRMVSRELKKRGK